MAASSSSNARRRAFSAEDGWDDRLLKEASHLIHAAKRRRREDVHLAGGTATEQAAASEWRREQAKGDAKKASAHKARQELRKVRTPQEHKEWLHAHLQGKAFWWSPSLPEMSQSVARQLGELGCLTEDLLKADVVFCKDPARPSPPAVMRALLAGCLVATPAALSAKTAVGACTQYRSALKTRRKLYISDAFVDEHPDEAAVLVDALESPQGRSWAVLATAQQFFLELEASVKRNRLLETLALVSDQECTEDQFQGLGSVYSLRTFLESWAQRQPACG